MYSSNNLILNSLSCLVLKHFAAVGSEYGILSILQSVIDMKISILNSSAADIKCLVSFLCCCFI